MKGNAAAAAAAHYTGNLHERYEDIARHLQNLTAMKERLRVSGPHASITQLNRAWKASSAIERSIQILIVELARQRAIVSTRV